MEEWVKRSGREGMIGGEGRCEVGSGEWKGGVGKGRQCRKTEGKVG